MSHAQRCCTLTCFCFACRSFFSDCSPYGAPKRGYELTQVLYCTICLTTIRLWKVTCGHGVGGAFVSRLQGEWVSDAKVLPAIFNLRNLLVESWHRLGDWSLLSVAVLLRLDSFSSYSGILPGE